MKESEHGKPMTRKELIEYCLTYPDAYEDYPFSDIQSGDKTWTVMRHTTGKKSFAFIFESDGLCINLKCEPMCADFLRQAYQGITAGYHMNKQHWNTVRTDSDVPWELIAELIEHSYRLTAKKPRAAKGKAKE